MPAVSIKTAVFEGVEEHSEDGSADDRVLDSQ